MKNQSVSDFVAASMDAVLNSKEHKALFETQYKTAAKCCARRSRAASTTSTPAISTALTSPTRSFARRCIPIPTTSSSSRAKTRCTSAASAPSPPPQRPLRATRRARRQRAPPRPPRCTWPLFPRRHSPVIWAGVSSHARMPSSSRGPLTSTRARPPFLKSRRPPPVSSATVALRSGSWPTTMRLAAAA